MNKQSRMASAAEAVVSTFAGFIVAYFLQLTLNHAYDVKMSNGTAAQMVVWFTLFSIIRSYAIRRLWANEFWKFRGKSWRNYVKKRK